MITPMVGADLRIGPDAVIGPDPVTLFTIDTSARSRSMMQPRPYSISRLARMNEPTPL
jgi:hypothetical protein